MGMGMKEHCHVIGRGWVGFLGQEQLHHWSMAPRRCVVQGCTLNLQQGSGVAYR